MTKGNLFNFLLLCLFLGDAKRFEMAAQEKDARKENMNNMRKNRAYQELKREMDQKRRAREKVRLLWVI